MTRKQFLIALPLSLGSVFGVVGLWRQLESVAKTPTADLEPEDGSGTGGMNRIADATASGGAAVGFGSRALPTTSELYKRCALGIATGSTAAHEAIEAELGAKLKNYVKYYDMGHNGVGN